MIVKDQKNKTTGDIAPQSEESEEAVLGVVLDWPENIAKMATIVQPEDFYMLRHSLIWRAMLDMHERKDTITALSLSEELRQRNQLDEIGGIAYLNYLMANAPMTPGWEVFGHIVQRLSVRRQLMQAAQEIVQQATSSEVDLKYITIQAHDILKAATSRTHQQSIATAVDIVGEVDSEIARREALVDTGETVGLPTGFAMIDEMSGGWMSEELILVAARSQHGKTAWLMNVMRNLAHRKIPFGFFSMEMSKMAIGFRWLAMETGLNSRIFKQPKSLIEIDNQRLIAEANMRMRDWKVMLDTTPRITAGYFSRKAEIMVGEGAQIIFVDYAQQMGGEVVKDPITGEKRRLTSDREIVNHNVQTLKEMAKSLKIPVVAAAQINREYFRSQDLRPTTAMLKESDNLESEPDVIYLLNTKCMVDGQGPMPDTAKGEAAESVIYCGKMRDGARHGDIAFDYFLHNQRFVERGPITTINIQAEYEKFSEHSY